MCWKSRISVGAFTAPAAAWKVSATGDDISDCHGSETSEDCQESGRVKPCTGNNNIDLAQVHK